MNENEIRVCSRCGCELTELYGVVHEGKDYCPICMHDMGYTECRGCGEWFDSIDVVTAEGGYTYCPDCATDEGYEMCENCGVWCDDTILVNLNTRDERCVCTDCINDHPINRYRGWRDTSPRYFLCHECGEWFSDDHDGGYLYNDSDEHVCTQCATDYYYTCCDCGNLVPENDVYSDDYGDPYCPECYEERSSRAIHEYGYKPEAEFRYMAGGFGKYTMDSTDVTELPFGIELEIDDGNDKRECADELMRNIGDDIYLKSDSSLNDAGFEIVTHPATLEFHQKVFPWHKLCRIATDYGYKSNDARTCGLHIHVGLYQLCGCSTNYATRDEVRAKLVMLVNRHWESLVKFSRRRESQLSHYARRPSFRFDDCHTWDEVARAALDEVNDDRYYAVNTCNYATVEFRLWNGSLVPETVLATIQLTSNMCKFVMGHTVEEVANSKWTDITHVEEFDELNDYLGRRGLGDEGLEVLDYELAPEVPDSMGGFGIGDQVVIAETSPFHRYLGDALATVWGFTEDGWIVIKFNKYNEYAHNAGGRVAEGYGYFVQADDIVYLKDYVNKSEVAADSPEVTSAQMFPLGSLIRLKPDCVYVTDPRFHLTTDMVGIVMTIDTHGDLGCYFEDLTSGHSLSGFLPVGNTHGWWVGVQMAEAVTNLECVG